MSCFLRAVALGLVLSGCAVVSAQQSQGRGERIEGRKGDNEEVWTLNDRTWDFKDVMTAYAPAKGHVEVREGQGQLAVWRLTLAKDFEEGTQRLHEEMRGSPFRVVLLDANRTVINQDVPGSITPVPARMGDSVEFYVALPSDNILKDVKYIRVQRRTDVGF